MGGRVSHSPEDVWKWIDVRAANDCWNWLGVKTPKGYGEFCMEYKKYRAHRVVYSMFNPSMDFRLSAFNKNSRLVLHKCDNPSCCNPSHLFEGTQRENILDRDSKGRRPKHWLPRAAA
jgi:hypothetical protein